MAGFLYKDIRVARGLIGTFLAIMQLSITLCVIVLYWLNDPEISCSLVALFGYFIMFFCVSITNTEIFAGDDRKVWQYFAISTPGAMEMQMKSKYLTTLLFNLIIFSCCMLTDTVAIMMAGDMTYSLQLPIFLFFCLSVIKEAITLPFIYAYGPSYGKTAQMLFLEGMIGIGVVYGLFGDISFFKESDVLARVLELLTKGNGIWVITAIPYLAGFLYWISLKISGKVYRWGVENIEN